MTDVPQNPQQAQAQSQNQPPQNPDQFATLVAALSTLQNQNHAPAKSEKTLDVIAFSGLGQNVQEDLEKFQIGLEAKFRVNADRYPSSESRVYYAFARTTERASSIVLDGVRTSKFADWQDLYAELELALGEVNPKFIASRRLLTLRQTHYTFIDFYFKFKLVA